MGVGASDRHRRQRLGRGRRDRPPPQDAPRIFERFLPGRSVAQPPRRRRRPRPRHRRVNRDRPRRPRRAQTLPRSWRALLDLTTPLPPARARRDTGPVTPGTRPGRHRPDVPRRRPSRELRSWYAATIARSGCSLRAAGHQDYDKAWRWWLTRLVGRRGRRRPPTQRRSRPLWCGCWRSSESVRCRLLRGRGQRWLGRCRWRRACR